MSTRVHYLQDGKTPLDIARKHNRRGLVCLLETGDFSSELMFAYVVISAQINVALTLERKSIELT